MKRGAPSGIDIDHLLLAGAGAVVIWIWYGSLTPKNLAVHGTVQLRAAIPYRFTYQTTLPIASATPDVAITARQNAIRLLLVSSNAYAIEFRRQAGLAAGEYLLIFTSAPPHDVAATIGTPLTDVAAQAFDLKLARIERLDGKAL